MGRRPPESGPEQRSIALAGEVVAYSLQRSRRRTIGLAIDHRGLTVGAPAGARLADIEALIRRHGAWVLEKLDLWRQRAIPEPLAVTDGLVVPLLGGEVRVRLAAGGRGAVWSGDGRELTLFPAPGADPRPLLERALRERARGHFAQCLAALAPRLGVPAPPLALSSARTRWGSCNSRGEIRLNWRLVFMPPAVVDYVAAHELAHLKEMNHGPRFWSLVEQLCPRWQEERRRLKLLGPTLPIF